MSPKTLIRSATPADLAAINDIYNHYVIASVCTYQEIPASTDERRLWFESHGTNHPIIVAEMDGEIVGFGALSPFRERSAFRFTVENSLYVRHDQTGRGVGEAMLRELIGRAKVIGHRAIIAVIDAEQTSSIRLHERNGFLRCAHLKQIGWKFDRWLDIIYLEYFLAGSSADLPA